MKVIDENTLRSFVQLETLKNGQQHPSGHPVDPGISGVTRQSESPKMTLPDIVVDFGIFESLGQLEQLELRSVFSLDATKKRQKLTKKDFDQLAGIKKLWSLALTHFELNSIDEDILKDFKKLTHIELSSNEIAEIHENAFKKCPSGLVSINIGSNKLKNLNPSCFEGIVPLRELNVSNNNISSENIGWLRSAVEKLGTQVIVVA